MKHASKLATALLAAAPLFAAHAAGSEPGIGTELQQELADARREVRSELAKAKRDLDTGNLRVDRVLVFGKDAARKPSGAGKDLPQAEITPRGDFLVDGKVQAIDAGQRRQLLAYRGQVIAIARDGIDIGQRSADAALAAVGNGSWVGLLFGAMTGSLERRVEAVVEQQVMPGVRSICRQLPALRGSQQQLAARLPQFRPYATLEADDVANCEKDIRAEFASR